MQTSLDLLPPTDFRRPVPSSKDFEGVYFICLRKGADVLRASGYFSYHPEIKADPDELELVYIGSSQNLCMRINRHIYGNCRVSSFRMTVASLIHYKLDLQPERIGLRVHFGETEKALSAWLEQHAVISFVPVLNSLVLERECIERLRPPFNISYQKLTPYARHLMRARERFGRRAQVPQYAPWSRRAAKQAYRAYPKGLTDGHQHQQGRVSLPPFDAT